MKLACKALALSAVTAAALSAATPAQAAPSRTTEGSGQTVGAYHQFRTERFGVGTSNSWQTVRRDSPLDTNSRALVTNVATDPDGTDDDYYYADAYTRAALNINRNAAQVRNLSFDFDRTRKYDAGSLRISVILGNGDVAYLSASTCDNPIAVSGDTWGRADFTGATLSNSGPCAFDVSGAFGGHYSNTADQSAWDVFTAAHPDAFVKYAFLVMDQPGVYVTDRIALGTNRLYNYGPTRAVFCSSEAAC